MNSTSCEQTLKTESGSNLHKASMRDYPSTVQIYTGDQIHSYIIRALVNLKDEISFTALRYAVDTAIKRYPSCFEENGVSVNDFSNHAFIYPKLAI